MCCTAQRCIPILINEQINLLKFGLADILEHGEDWSGAARVLRGINLEASQRYIDASLSTRASWILTNDLLIAQTKRNFECIFALSVYSLRRKTPCRRKLIITALPLLSILQ